MTMDPVGAWTPSVDAVAGATPTTMTSPPPTPHLDGTLDGIAQSLSLSPDALRSALAQGSSITDLAQQQGVSRDDLVKSVETQVQQTRQQNGRGPVDQTTLDRMVNRAFDRHRGGQHHRTSDATAPTPSQVPSTTDPTQTPGSGGVDLLA